MRQAAVGLALALGFAVAARAAAPEVVASPVPPVDLNALLQDEGNGTVFHKDGVDERVSQACRLQPRIDTWAEGSVITLERGSLVIFGHKLPYATLYARMMTDITARTKGLTGTALADRVKAIQQEWQAKKLSPKELTPPDTDTEISFVLARGGRLAMLDDGGEIMARVGGPLHLPASVHGAPVTKSAASSEESEEPDNDAKAASDIVATSPSQADDDTETLHVGDKIRVGYDSKNRPPMAFVSYRTARPSSVIAIDGDLKK